MRSGKLFQARERKTQVVVEFDGQQITLRSAQEVLKRANRDGQARIVAS